jgi:hypothetical protein
LTALIEVQYLPSVAYFSALVPVDEIVLERWEHYEKQSYRNRSHILTSQGVSVLTVPVTSRQRKAYTKEVKIDYSQKWLNNHWRSIISAYAKAPYFEYYADELENLLYRKNPYLYDLNVDLLSLCLKWLKWSKQIKESLLYEKEPKQTIRDLRTLIHPKEPDLLQKIYKPVAYYQVFGNGFVTNLSVIDLIFCKGPEAARIVEASAVSANK